MLHKALALHNFTLHSTDGEIGRIKDFYFDDHHWAVRYLVADTGTWLSQHQVLLSPHALVAVHEGNRNISVNLTNRQIEQCPPLDSDRPVSRQYEEDYYGYYGWPMYFSGPYLWGWSPNLVKEQPLQRTPNAGGSAWDPHLRSTRDVTGHAIMASDGPIGHVEDFIIEDNNWAIRYLVIHVVHGGKSSKRLVSPQWVERVDWGESRVYFNLTREIILGSPELTAETLPTHNDEEILHRHFGQRGYWTTDQDDPRHGK